MEFDRISELYNLCNPEESLQPDDPRNVDIDQTGVRGEKWSERLAKQTEKVVLQAEGKTNKPLSDGPFKRLWTWLTTTDVELSKLSLEAFGGGADFNLKTNPTVRARVRDILGKHPAQFVKLVRDELEDLDLRAKLAGNKGGLFVIFDSLEKLRGTSLTWRDVLTSAERIFANGAPLLQLPVSVLFTVPPALARRMNDPVEFLPMIKVRDKEGVLSRGDRRHLPAGEEAHPRSRPQRIVWRGSRAKPPARDRTLVRWLSARDRPSSAGIPRARYLPHHGRRSRAGAAPGW